MYYYLKIDIIVQLQAYSQRENSQKYVLFVFNEKAIVNKPGRNF